MARTFYYQKIISNQEAYSIDLGEMSAAFHIGIEGCISHVHRDAPRGTPLDSSRGSSGPFNLRPYRRGGRLIEPGPNVTDIDESKKFILAHMTDDVDPYAYVYSPFSVPLEEVVGVLGMEAELKEG